MTYHPALIAEARALVRDPALAAARPFAARMAWKILRGLPLFVCIIGGRS